MVHNLLTLSDHNEKFHTGQAASNKTLYALHKSLNFAVSMFEYHCSFHYGAENSSFFLINRKTQRLKISYNLVVSA